MPMHRIRWQASPHFNFRPDGVEIDLIVLHAISLPPGEFDQRNVEDFFAGELDISAHAEFSSLEGVHVSAHFLVDRAGHITQFVRCADRAWHAGASSWQGRENCNDFAIGIEMIGDESQPFTSAQYRECARLCRRLMLEYPAIGKDHIVGHQHIAPGRKWDPGEQWDWARFRRSLAHIKSTELELQ